MKNKIKTYSDKLLSKKKFRKAFKLEYKSLQSYIYKKDRLYIIGKDKQGNKVAFDIENTGK